MVDRVREWSHVRCRGDQDVVVVEDLLKVLNMRVCSPSASAESAVLRPIASSRFDTRLASSSEPCFAYFA